MKQSFCMGNSSRESYHVPNRSVASIMPFYVSGFGHFTCDHAYFTEREEYPECLLLYTVKGCGSLKYQGEEKTIPENCLAVIDCRQYQLYRTLGEHWEFYWVHFDGKCASDFTGLLNGKGLAVLQAGHLPEAASLFAELQRLNRSENRNMELNLSSYMHQLLCRIADLQYHDATVSKYRALQPDIDRAIGYIHENYGQPVTVDTLAEISRMSKYHFIRVFRELTGDTPYNYLTLYRIGQSKRLLTDTAMSVQEIAQEVGFSNAKNYIACFRKYTMTTPSRFREGSLV